MPINIPDNLPARWMLESEGIFVIGHGSAACQNLRPLRIALVLPDQDRNRGRGLVRLISQSPLQIELEVIALGALSATSRSHDPQDPLAASQSFDAVQQQSFDGVVVAHAPFAGRDWHEAPNWDEFRDFLDWSDGGLVRARMFLGWSAQAALHHVYGLTSHQLESGPTGISHCRAVRGNSYLMRGFDARFNVPIRAHAQIDAQDLADMPGLQVLADSDQAGPYLVRNANRRDVFVLGQPELDPVLAGSVPEASGTSEQPWASHASLLMLNWLNYYVYQPTSQQVDPVLTAPLVKPQT